MSKWIDIKLEKPYNDEPVYYYFNVFDKVYRGFYCEEDVSHIFNEPYGTYKSDCFYGKSGFLCDDVKYWMPREDTDSIIYPDKPSKDKSNV
jgi:hypothetical protein